MLPSQEKMQTGMHTAHTHAHAHHTKEGKINLFIQKGSRPHKQAANFTFLEKEKMKSAVLITKL